jgi:hypothetical protein
MGAMSISAYYMKNARYKPGYVCTIENLEEV